MACENCKYWKPTYAPYVHKMIMTCTNETTEDKSGRCKEFKRRPYDTRRNIKNDG